MLTLDSGLDKYDITNHEKRCLRNRIEKTVDWYLIKNNYNENIMKFIKPMKIDFIFKKLECFDIKDVIDKKIHIKDLVSGNLNEYSQYFIDKKNEIIDKISEVDEYGSTLYVCPKCKQRKQTIKQIQTRSLDEGATFKATCVCGHIWTV